MTNSRSERPRRTAVNIDDRALTIARLRGREEGDHAGDLGRFAETGDLVEIAEPGIVGAMAIHSAEFAARHRDCKFRELIKQIFALEDAKSRHLDRGFIEPTLTVKDYAPRPEIPFRPDSVAAVH